jgi:hypothetical protein
VEVKTMKRPLRSPFLFVAMLAVLLALAGTGVFAENIVAPDQYAYAERLGWINFKPGTGPGITVTNTDITGSAWGERIGWISMSCHNDEPGTTCASRGNWEVTNSGAGNLKGYAWSEREGWISFSCHNDEPAIMCSTRGNWGVTINPSTGVFSGQAWGENIGWITFSCPGSARCGSTAYSVRTNWTGPACATPGDCDHDAGYPPVYGDACVDSKEPGPSHTTGGQRDPTSPWDFYSVPVPALRLNPTGTRDNGIGVTTDVVALLAYSGKTSGSPDYIADFDGNGVQDGLQYDRSPSTTAGQPWRSGPPDGGIGITTDVVAMLAQSGDVCT